MAEPTVLSLFSGIGGFDLGLERAGFRVVGQVEIDPFCQKVLAHHWPDVARYSDVRNVAVVPTEHAGRGEADGRRGPDSGSAGGAARDEAAELPRVDLVCGGFPCQDLSVAGKRAGLDGARSGLWFEFHRILSELRPTFCLIENVPGLLSSNQGRDFGIVLAGLGELWPAVGWAILDSQHFGVPQRRRRVYIVGGPSRACVQQILSLCEGGDWNTQARRAEREDVAPTLNGGANRTGGDRPPGTQVDTAESLVLAHSLRGQAQMAHREDVDTLVAASVTSKWAKGTGGPSGDEAQNKVLSHSLRADGFDASEDGTGRGTPIVALQGAGKTSQGSNGDGWQEDISYTLNVTDVHGDAVNMSTVRRLMPVECERLQGFPDGWTDVDGAKDGPRYKALGNAVTVPVIEYLGRRIYEVLRG